MKKIIFIIAIFALSNSSCDSGSSAEDIAQNNPEIGTTNSTYATALDNSNLTFSSTSGNNANWCTTTSQYYAGGSSLRSGLIGNSQTSCIQTTIPRAGTFSFYWKVSSENSRDYLKFYYNNSVQNTISGTTSWAQKTYNYTGSYAATLKWCYIKDSSISQGSDAGWIDDVQFTASN